MCNKNKPVVGDAFHFVNLEVVHQGLRKYEGQPFEVKAPTALDLELGFHFIVKFADGSEMIAKAEEVTGNV